jgi:hypothetical protein
MDEEFKEFIEEEEIKKSTIYSLKDIVYFITYSIILLFLSILIILLSILIIFLILNKDIQISDKIDVNNIIYTLNILQNISDSNGFSRAVNIVNQLLILRDIIILQYILKMY